MVYLAQIVQWQIDFGQFEKLLSSVSRIVNLAVDIKDLNGESLVRTCNSPDEMDCDIQGWEPDRCYAESSGLFLTIEQSGKSEVQKCCESAEIIGIPLIGRSSRGPEGILFACSRTGTGIISNDVKEFLEEIAGRISTEIQNQTELNDFSEELSEKYEELNLVYDIGNKLVGASNTQQVVEYIADQANDTLSSDIIIISVPQDDIYETIYSDKYTAPKDVLLQSQLNNISESFMNILTSPEKPSSHIVINDIQSDVQLSRLTDIPMALLAVPIRLKREIGGFLCLIKVDRKKLFQTGDVSLALSLAQQISSTLTNTKLYQDLKDFLLSVIKTLIYSIEAKDSYTKGHSERVNNLTMLIADQMDMSVEEQESIHWAAILHDIGKIGVPEEILIKPGKLNGEEMMEIQKHPERGYGILLPIAPLRDSLMGIRHHHEQYDGTGYPSGLKGEEIPLPARIIAVADTYDAMTSTRSYRSSMSFDDAIAELIRVKGTQLDSEIVDIFLKVIEGSEHK